MTAARFRSETAALMRRNRTLLAGAAIPMLLGLLFVVGAVITREVPLVVPAIPLTLISGLAMSLAYRANMDPVRVEGAVEVDARGLCVGGRVVALRKRITGAFLNPLWPPHVRIARSGASGSLTIRVRDQDEGKALVRALGYDASQTVAEIRAASPVLSWPLRKQMQWLALPVLGSLASMFLSMPLWLRFPPIAAIPVFAIIASSLTLAVMTLSRTRVRIGADGIGTHWLGREAFYPLGQVELVEPSRRSVGGRVIVGVDLVLTHGRRVPIPCGQQDRTVVEPAELAERIQESLGVHRRSGARAASPEALVRRGRPVPAWITALRAMGAGANADLRTAPVDPHDMLRIAEDGAAPAETRAAAAIAALPELGSAAKTRIRVAAETTVSPSLRVALERIASDEPDDRAIEEALSALEPGADPESDLSLRRSAP